MVDTSKPPDKPQEHNQNQFRLDQQKQQLEKQQQLDQKNQQLNNPPPSQNNPSGSPTLGSKGHATIYDTKGITKGGEGQFGKPPAPTETFRSSFGGPASTFSGPLYD